MARDLGLATPTVFALLSLALIVSALVGPVAGRLIDRHGGRAVLMAGNGVFAAGLLLMGSAHGFAALLLAWLLLGVAMGAGLYDAAFAALVRLYGADARRSITGITLIAGFASTVGWPATALLQAQFGWRGACFVWAALHILVGLPLNALLPRSPGLPTMGHAAVPPPTADEPAVPAPPAQTRPAPPRRLAPLLALFFALTSMMGTAVATQLPAVLQIAGASVAAAVAAAALVGPAQVAGRLLELGWLRRLSPLVAARAAALGHPAGALLLLALGAGAAAPFAVLHGLGNGLLTIVRGTLPLALFGAEGYGARQGWLILPARVLSALAPWLFGLALAQWGVLALWITAALGVTAYLCLLLLRQAPA